MSARKNKKTQEETKTVEEAIKSKEEPKKYADDAWKYYLNNCKKGGDEHSKSNDIWLCYDCKKFMCTKCYSKGHKLCCAELVDKLKEDRISQNKKHKETLDKITGDLENSAKSFDDKTKAFMEDAPFDEEEKLIDKIYGDLLAEVSSKKDDMKMKNKKLKELYEQNMNEKKERIDEMVDNTTEDIKKDINSSTQRINKQDPLDYCKDYLDREKSASDIEDKYRALNEFHVKYLSRYSPASVDPNIAVFNDANSLLEECRDYREFIFDKTKEFEENAKEAKKGKRIYSVVMNKKEFVVYMIEGNNIRDTCVKKIRITKFLNNFVIPAYSRWISVADTTLFLTGGEKDFVESLDDCYMFKFYEGDQEEIANVIRKKNMIHKRRAHSLIWFKDYIYAISGVDKLDMINHCEKYDVVNDVWEEVPPLNIGRQNAALAIYNEKYLYAFGGYDGFKNLDSIERLDGSQDNSKWELIEVGDLNVAENVVLKKNRMGVIPLDFGKVLLFGGERNNKEHKDSAIFDFQEKRFVPYQELAKNATFLMSPTYMNGKHFIFDSRNNIHDFNLNNNNFEFFTLAKEGETAANQ